MAQEAKLRIMAKADSQSIRQVQDELGKSLSLDGVGRELQTGTSNAADNVRKGMEQTNQSVSSRMGNMARSVGRIVRNIGIAIGAVLAGVAAGIYALKRFTDRGDELRKHQERIRRVFAEFYSGIEEQERENLIQRARERERHHVTTSEINREEFRRMQSQIASFSRNLRLTTEEELDEFMETTENAFVGMIEGAKAMGIRFQPYRVIDALVDALEDAETSLEDALSSVTGLHHFGLTEDVIAGYVSGSKNEEEAIKKVMEHLEENTKVWRGISGHIAGIDNIMGQLSETFEEISTAVAENIAPHAQKAADAISNNKEEIARFFDDTLAIMTFIVERVAPIAAEIARLLRLHTDYKGYVEEEMDRFRVHPDFTKADEVSARQHLKLLRDTVGTPHYEGHAQGYIRRMQTWGVEPEGEWVDHLGIRHEVGQPERGLHEIESRRRTAGLRARRERGEFEARRESQAIQDRGREARAWMGGRYPGVADIYDRFMGFGDTQGMIGELHAGVGSEKARELWAHRRYSRYGHNIFNEGGGGVEIDNQTEYDIDVVVRKSGEDREVERKSYPGGTIQ